MVLEDHSEVYYLVTQFYNKDMEAGLRWNDPAFGIVWPDIIKEISVKDNKHPDFDLKNIL
jgi:dTDP-4-dehydrorhamnose 3,5-epimerase